MAELSKRVAASLECLEDRLLLSGTSVIVSPAAVPPPVASAGANQTVNVNATATLSGTVTYTAQSGATLSTVWQLANGPGTVTFGNSASPQTTATFSAAGTYYLHLLATYAGVSDQSYTTITVNPASQPTTTTLQQGTNSYSGMVDTYIYDAKNDDATNYSTSTTLSVIGPQKSKEADALMLWNLTTAGISGTIQSASIQVYVTTTSTDTYNLYAMSTPWNVSQVTFDQPSNTTQWQDDGANGPADYNSTVLGTLTPTATGLATITLNAAGIADLQAWLSNPSSNYGFVIKDANTNGSASVTIASSKYATVADRPSLSITVAGTGGGGSSGNQTITNPVTSATAAVNGTSGSPGYMSGIGLDLATLYYQDLQYQQSGSTSGFTPNLTQAGINAGDVSGSNVSVFVQSESTTIGAHDGPSRAGNERGDQLGKCGRRLAADFAACQRRHLARIGFGLPLWRWRGRGDAAADSVGSRRVSDHSH